MKLLSFGAVAELLFVCGWCVIAGYLFYICLCVCGVLRMVLWGWRRLSDCQLYHGVCLWFTVPAPPCVWRDLVSEAPSSDSGDASKGKTEICAPVSKSADGKLRWFAPLMLHLHSHVVAADCSLPLTRHEEEPTADANCHISRFQLQTWTSSEKKTYIRGLFVSWKWSTNKNHVGDDSFLLLLLLPSCLYVEEFLLHLR